MSQIIRPSASLILVVDTSAPDAARLAEVSARLAAAFVDAELLLVANACEAEVARKLAADAATVPDTTVQFLADRADRDGALLAGLASAIGDQVFMFEDLAGFDAAFPALLEALDKGAEAVLAWPDHPDPAPLSERLFVGLFNRLTDGRALAGRPLAWAYSRDAARHVLQSLSSEMLLRSPEIATGFASATVTVPGNPAPFQPRGLRRASGKAVRLLIGTSAVPLRLMTAFGMAGALIALVYSVYAVVTYLIRDNVAPGWTTLSLLMAFMLFLTSVMFAVLAEYIVLIQRGSGSHRRTFVSREVRGPLSRRTGRLNVVGADGGFHLGAPDKGA